MNEFDSYGEESPLKPEAGWSNGIGWGFGSAPGRGSDLCTGSTPFETICPPKPSLGNFLIYAFCIIALLLGLWMI